MSKKYEAALALIEKGKTYSVAEAVELVKKTNTVKFDGSVSISFNLGIDARQADQQLRGTLVLPHGNGKTKKILAITSSKVAEATEAGADYVGGKELLQKIQSENWFDFDGVTFSEEDTVLTLSTCCRKYDKANSGNQRLGELGRMGKILGPKGLMPNPKTGTVTPNIGAAVKEIKNGKIEYRTDKEGNMHIMLGKVSFSNEDLAENVQTVIDTVIRVKPAAQKGTYIKKAVLHSVMGPAIHLAI